MDSTFDQVDTYEETEVFFGPITDKEKQRALNISMPDDTMIQDVSLCSFLSDQEKEGINDGEHKEFTASNFDKSDSSFGVMINSYHGEPPCNFPRKSLEQCFNLEISQVPCSPQDLAISSYSKSCQTGNPEISISPSNSDKIQNSNSHLQDETPSKVSLTLEKLQIQPLVLEASMSDIVDNFSKDMVNGLPLELNLTNPSHCSEKIAKKEINFPNTCKEVNPLNILSDYNSPKDILPPSKCDSTDNSLNSEFHKEDNPSQKKGNELTKKFSNADSQVPLNSTSYFSSLSVIDVNDEQIYGSFIQKIDSHLKHFDPNLKEDVDRLKKFEKPLFTVKNQVDCEDVESNAGDCSIVSNASSKYENMNFNDTLEEVEWLLKQGQKYANDATELAENNTLDTKVSTSNLNKDIPKGVTPNPNGEQPEKSHSNRSCTIKDMPEEIDVPKILEEPPCNSFKNLCLSYKKEMPLQFESDLSSSHLETDKPVSSSHLNTFSKPLSTPPTTPSKKYIPKCPPMSDSRTRIPMKSMVQNINSVKSKMFFTPQPIKRTISHKSNFRTPIPAKVNCLSIVSPVAKYLKDNPPPPLIATVKPRHKISPLKLQIDHSSYRGRKNSEERKTVNSNSSLKDTPGTVGKKKAPLPSLTYTPGRALQIENKENNTIRAPSILPKSSTSVIKHKGRVKVPKNPALIDLASAQNTKENCASQAGRVSMMEVSLCEPHSIQHTNTLKKQIAHH